MIDPMIPRHFAELDRFLRPGKVLVLYGPRQVGKTNLLRNYLNTAPCTAHVQTGEHVRRQ